MKQDVTILGGPSDGMKLAVKQPLAATFAVVEKAESTGDQTVDYCLIEHPLTKHKVYAHPTVYARLIHGQTDGNEEIEGQSTED